MTRSFHFPAASLGLLGILFSACAPNLEGTIGMAHGLDLRFIATRAWMGDRKKENQEADPEDGYVTQEGYFKASGLDRDLSAFTVRFKWNPAQNRFWAMTAGGGRGWTQGQSFYSFETAQILGVENRVCVPYLNLRYMINIPVSPRAITIDDSENWEGYEGYSKKPETTVGTEMLVGIKIPLTGHRKDRLRANPAYLKAEVGFLSLADTGSSVIGGVGNIAFVLPFGGF
jgi:hypothetical protein